jgi:hypothetical protein
METGFERIDLSLCVLNHKISALIYQLFIKTVYLFQGLMLG